MRVIALTGNIAAGKSTVAAILRRQGVTVIDSDAIVRELQRPGTTVFHAIVDRFGSGILRSSGELDRPKLRDLIMSDSHAKQDLEAIVHPAVVLRQYELLDHERARGAAIVIVDIPLLFEAGDPAAYQGVILVDAPADVRRDRLLNHRSISADQADQLMASQLPAAAKRPRATWILENDAGIEQLEQRTIELWHTLRQ